MSVLTTERIQFKQLETYPIPLDAGQRLYTFDEIASAPAYFMSDGDPIQLHCLGLEQDKDGYNPSGIHLLKVHAGDTEPTAVTIVRTEQGEGAYAAESRFCSYDESGELTELDIPRMPWEDAAICVLPDGTIVTSGVRVIWNKDDPTKVDRFFTEFFYGPTLEEQVYLGQSPDGYKDTRIGVVNNKAGLWIRPQQRSYEGKVNYTELSIEELHAEPNERGERVAQAVFDRARPVGAGIFAEGTWGGPNHITDVGNGWVLVHSHASRRVWENSIQENAEGKRQGISSEFMEYVAFMLLHHVDTGTAYIFGPHATEEQFPPGDAKWHKVRKVLFPGGLHDVKVTPDAHVEGMATYGLRDKDMYVRHWRTVIPLAWLLNTTL